MRSPPGGRGELGAGLVGPLFGRRLLLEDRRVDRARADRIDPDATILQLRRPRSDEGAYCRLAGAVSGEAGDALVLGDRGDHDDRPAVIQKRQGLFHREGQSPGVDRKELVEAFLRRLGERLGIDDARPGEEDIDLALFAGDLVYSRSRSARLDTSPCTAAMLRPISDTALSSSVRRRAVM